LTDVIFAITLGEWSHVMLWDFVGPPLSGFYEREQGRGDSLTLLGEHGWWWSTAGGDGGDRPALGSAPYLLMFQRAFSG
jgi:hypothetical protein